MDEQFRTRLGNAMKQIIQEYRNNEPPFREFQGELWKAAAEITSVREEALFKTLTIALNYQRDADSHYRTFRELWHEKHWLFEPATVVERKSLEDIIDVFKENGVRYPKKDAKIWNDICLKLYLEYESNPLNIFEEANYDFDKVEQTIRGNTLNEGYISTDFPYLRGQKIRPLWLRIMRSSLPEYSGFEDTEVAVDTHIIGITNRICGTDYEDTPRDKEEIRQFWQRVCEPKDINPIQLDFPLWLINRNWNDWGEQYLTDKLETNGIEIGEGQSNF